MCGLFGIAILGQNTALHPSEIETARRSRDILSHRGPDQSGEAIANGVYLGHRRLSILDLSESGRQPMISDDQTVAITVNGEIYNFQELRAQLEQAGYMFRSHSDSEIVLHGYRHWGAEKLADLMDGMYVCVIHDRASNTLSIIRDRAGIKPLYYYNNGRFFVWSSELKGIVAWAGRTRLVYDPEALYDYLTHAYIPAPKSCYKNVFKLPQASILNLRLDTGAVQIKPYWHLPLQERREPAAKLAEELLFLLKKSIHEQLMGDVPVGFFLSGGIDSSAITTLAAQEHPAPMTFTISFPNTSRDESAYAAEIATLVKTQHAVQALHDDEMHDLPKRLGEWFDEPYNDHSCIPLYKIAAFARQKVTVALSGDGGDELFGGYKVYNAYHRIRKLQRAFPFKAEKGIRFPQNMPQRRRLSLLSISDPVYLYCYLRGDMHDHDLALWRAKLGIPEDYDSAWAYRARYRPDINPRKAAQIMDFYTYLPDDILTKVDRVTMAVSLECRPPFLSRDLIEFAFSLPEDFLYRGGQLKGGLKMALAGILPDRIINRGKQGFSVPGTIWRDAVTGNSGTMQEALLESFLEKT